MKTLVYLSLGDGIHNQEALYSIHTATHLMGSRHGEVQIVVYTDRPDRFEKLPVRTELVLPERRAEWCGPLGFFFRCKICVLSDALNRFGGACAYVDADTYFVRAPQELLERIRPGHSLMHRLEGNLYSWGAGITDRIADKQWREFCTTAGEPWELSPLLVNYNAGVLGLHQKDAGILLEVLALSDALYAKSRHYLCEQIAFSACLPRWTQRGEAYKFIYHYCCHTPTKSEFDRALPNYLQESSVMPEPARSKWLYKHRPVEPLRFTIPRGAKDALKRMGFFRNVKRTKLDSV